MADRAALRARSAHRRPGRRCVAGRPGRPGVRRHPHRRRRAGGDAAPPGRRQGAAGPSPRRPAHPCQLPDRHADRLHDGADALGAPPGGVPGGARRRGVPPPGRVRRRRRARPRSDDRGTGQPLRGPPVAARRDRRGHGAVGDHLHRRQRVLGAAQTAGGAARRAARRPRRHHTQTGTRPCPHPASVAAVRCSQRHAGSAGRTAGRAVHVRHHRADRREGRDRRADRQATTDRCTSAHAAG
ncbi:hypothetical protein MCHUDSM44219_00808 [Mycolicibacterium chubuense]|uniref:Uncharacterized protein n=1 Tax=Mycolicibacterium chubuense TaxID=1800 RepID=A0A0J6ZH89_MYCCU|nr:hypothetical protein MCHUDSM44219_00808 [Mycolicibacterium chubuense]